MECKNCKYNTTNRLYRTCAVGHWVNAISCTLKSDEDVPKLNICYNCKHWIGGGDWGLSCAVDYYNCNNNGFKTACEKFEVKK